MFASNPTFRHDSIQNEQDYYFGDLSDRQIENSLVQIDKKVKDLDKIIAESFTKYLNDPYFDGVNSIKKLVIKKGIELIDDPELYVTSIYAPFDVIIHKVNACILGSWIRSSEQFEIWMQRLINEAGPDWNFADYKVLAPGLYIVDNHYLCIDLVKALVNPYLSNDIAALFKNHTDIFEVYISGRFQPIKEPELKQLLKDGTGPNLLDSLLQ